VTCSGETPETPKEIKSMSKEKRTKRIEITVTNDEYESLMQLKTQHHLASWMREVCLNKKTKRRGKPPTVDPALLRHLAAIGNNVNQIARQCNSTLSATDAIDVLIRLDAIESTLQEIRDQHDSKNL